MERFVCMGSCGWREKRCFFVVVVAFGVCVYVCVVEIWEYVCLFVCLCFLIILL